jgi:hypothetical protein
MIGNSRTLQLILGIDMVALLLYNIAGMLVTGHLGAVFRTVLETMRTLFVWLVSGCDHEHRSDPLECPGIHGDHTSVASEWASAAAAFLALTFLGSLLTVFLGRAFLQPSRSLQLACL